MRGPRHTGSEGASRLLKELPRFPLLTPPSPLESSDLWEEFLQDVPSGKVRLKSLLLKGKEGGKGSEKLNPEKMLSCFNVLQFFILLRPYGCSLETLTAILLLLLSREIIAA